MNKKREIFISVDVETAGPIVSEHSMLTVGACLVYQPEVSFSMMLKPISDKSVEEALAVTGLTLEQAERDGLTPTEAMAQFASWVADNTPEDCTPVFVGLNASFDWGFVNYYFLKYFGSNPFGISALDIKALFMGVTGCTWYGTKSSAIDKVVNPYQKGNHDALDDARYQGELFRLIYRLSQKAKNT
ncbi:3'-5' exonuclease [Vibrio parahaemolyticus]|uniref:3'-5' exonuclease n=1 Tax=Vibrio parahaemolyticus TaxID=670 RepID=UPI0004268F71|nr:3'-5' exonuclease [Vibrio parahaemolyticus]KIT25091.1 exonuclease [Vibrio parahaemolyticus VP766]EGR2769638.1 3'-5' exonuclease [Vibrio parahaemolyticus]EGR2834170.1 3'-5' exonuclease [Vibrio parahaemolyticus]EGR2888639.1 3'-5' exonuclease [Vibrio parahaemolyticus]EGR2907144.1 3'-5' exonuclease [Vibrio parahaemolyticus]